MFEHHQKALRRTVGGLVCINVLSFSLLAEDSRTWTLSPEDASADFISIEQAIDSDLVAEGDTLFLMPSKEPYPSATLTRHLHLKASPEGPNAEPSIRIGTLTVQPDFQPEGAPLVVEGIGIGACEIRLAQVHLDYVKLGSLRIEGESHLIVSSSWLDFELDGVLLGMGPVHAEFRNSLLIFHGGAPVSFMQDSRVSFIHNTIIDPDGLSEWVIYQGLFENNILTIPEGRLALFEGRVTHNLSNRFSFRDTENNTNSIQLTTLLDTSGKGLQAFVPAQEGPAAGGAPDGTDIGFTGGSLPPDLARIPGSGVASPDEHIPLENFFGDDLGHQQDWSYSPWYGWMQQVRNGLFYHIDHAWQSAVGSPDSLFLFDYGTNMWWWTSATLYPNLFFLTSPQGWVFYYPSTAFPYRFFYQYETDAITMETDL